MGLFDRLMGKKNNIYCDLLWESGPNQVETELILPKTLFKLQQYSSPSRGDSFTSTVRNVVMTERRELVIETRTVTFDAHNILHHSIPYIDTEPITFDRIPQLIEDSNDLEAKKYVRLNQDNWEELLSTPKAVRKASVYPILKLGMYPMNNEIEWYVLDIQGETALLVSKYGLRTQPWHNMNVPVSWTESSLCDWLNHPFCQIAFSPSVRKALEPFDDMTKVSLLDQDIIDQYLKADSAVVAMPVKTALDNGAFSYTFSVGRPDCKHHVGNGLIWLKTTYTGDKPTFKAYAQCIYWDGSICIYPFTFNKAVVRPCIKLNLMKAFGRRQATAMAETFRSGMKGRQASAQSEARSTAL